MVPIKPPTRSPQAEELQPDHDLLNVQQPGVPEEVADIVKPIERAVSRLSSIPAAIPEDISGALAPKKLQLQHFEMIKPEAIATAIVVERAKERVQGLIDANPVAPLERVVKAEPALQRLDPLVREVVQKEETLDAVEALAPIKEAAVVLEHPSPSAAVAAVVAKESVAVLEINPPAQIKPRALADVKSDAKMAIFKISKGKPVAPEDKKKFKADLAKLTPPAAKATVEEEIPVVLASVDKLEKAAEEIVDTPQPSAPAAKAAVEVMVAAEVIAQRLRAKQVKPVAPVDTTDQVKLNSFVVEKGGGDPKHPKCQLTKHVMCQKVIEYVDEFAKKNQRRNRAGQVVGGQTAKAPNDTCNKLAEDQSSESFGCFSCCGRAFTKYKLGGPNDRSFKKFCRSKDPCMLN